VTIILFLPLLPLYCRYFFDYRFFMTYLISLNISFYASAKKIEKKKIVRIH